MSSERQAFNDGFEKGYAKAQERIAQLENKVMKLHGALDILEAEIERLRELQHRIAGEISYTKDINEKRGHTMPDVMDRWVKALTGGRCNNEMSNL